MADIFTKNDAQRVVEFKVIWFCGDSSKYCLCKHVMPKGKCTETCSTIL